MEPKFQKGQRVRVIDGDWKGREGYILSVNTFQFAGNDPSISYDVAELELLPINLAECDLELIPEYAY